MKLYIDHMIPLGCHLSVIFNSGAEVVVLWRCPSPGASNIVWGSFDDTIRSPSFRICTCHRQHNIQAPFLPKSRADLFPQWDRWLNIGDPRYTRASSSTWVRGKTTKGTNLSPAPSSDTTPSSWAQPIYCNWTAYPCSWLFKDRNVKLWQVKNEYACNVFRNRFSSACMHAFHNIIRTWTAQFTPIAVL